MNLLELQRENEALKLENEALKLKLFWKEHNPSILKSYMSAANYVEGGYWCSCLACAVSGRHEKEYGETDENMPCQFKPWFEQMLREHDMSIGYGIPDVPIWVDGSVCDSGNNVLDDGQHFTILGRQDWLHWTYGSRLWKATSVLDPELAKLERLFKTLDMVAWEDTEE